ncbi:MAG: hypothetical protein ABI353_19850, partial [Isosphaeraceae bacterium]
MRRIPSALMVLVASASLVHAQDVAPEVGQRVVTKPHTLLRVGRQVVDDDSVFRVYTVKQVNGDWLWLVADSVSGWVRSGSVVAFDRAIDYFTQQIQAGPESADLYYYSRGLIWKAKGETDIAISDFSDVIRLDPEAAGAFVSRGNAWY